MEDRPAHVGDAYPTVIEGRSYLICTEEEYKEHGTERSGRWRAWAFFAYDADLNIYPADDVPRGVSAQESITGASGDSEAEARRGVEDHLRRAIRDRNLDGTGFYCPASDIVWPQGVNPPKPRRKQ